MSNMLNTRSGAQLDLRDPDPADIKLDDVAGSLAMVPRFGAQTQRFYSVAQHAVSVARIAEALDREDLALAALHHDSHEAFICDLPKPVKNMIGPRYEELADELDRAIEKAFGIELEAKGTPDGDFIKEIDNAVFIFEAQHLLLGEYETEKVAEQVKDVAEQIVGDLSVSWSPFTGEAQFLALHNRLKAQANNTTRRRGIGLAGTTRKIGEVRPEVANFLEGSSSIVVDDPYEQQHWELVFAHPEFKQDFAALLDELQHVYPRDYADEEAANTFGLMVTPSDFEMALYDDDSAPYSVDRLAEKWGLPPAALLQDLLGNPESEFGEKVLQSKKRDLSSILVWETAASFNIRIPRPLTSARQQGLNDWLSQYARRGKTEQVFRATTHQRTGKSLAEAIPWFARWVAGEPPNEIWQEVHESNRNLSFKTFVQQLRRLWERMRALSPEGVPTKGPSEKIGQGPEA